MFILLDACTDQFSGPNEKKFLYKQFEELSIKNHNQPAEFQKNELLNSLTLWMKATEQVDGILVIGIKI